MIFATVLVVGGLSFVAGYIGPLFFLAPGHPGPLLGFLLHRSSWHSGRAHCAAYSGQLTIRPRSI